VGRKIGLTSLAIQKQLGVNEPDYGSLWESSYYPTIHNRAEVPASVFLQPRLEAEVAFLIGRPLEGSHLTPQEVLAATDAMGLVVEIVASRIADWRIKLVDTIADNASYGGFVLGEWDHHLRYEDLRLLGVTIHKNGEHVAEGVGAAAQSQSALYKPSDTLRPAHPKSDDWEWGGLSGMKAPLIKRLIVFRAMYFQYSINRSVLQQRCSWISDRNRRYVP
jgi:hypothetical protein